MKVLQEVKLEVTNTVKALTVPNEAVNAIMVIEQDPTATQEVIARFFETNNPAIDNGLPLANLSRLDLEGKIALNGFKIIATESGVTHSLWIQFRG